MAEDAGGTPTVAPSPVMRGDDQSLEEVEVLHGTLCATLTINKKNKIRKEKKM